MQERSSPANHGVTVAIRISSDCSEEYNARASPRTPCFADVYTGARPRGVIDAVQNINIKTKTESQ